MRVGFSDLAGRLLEETGARVGITLGRDSFDIYEQQRVTGMTTRWRQPGWTCRLEIERQLGCLQDRRGIIGMLHPGGDCKRISSSEEHGQCGYISRIS